jgi:putative salt-induced outer membrane protein
VGDKKRGMKNSTLAARSPVILAGLAALPSPAFAELPQPVRAMVEAAIASGDKAKVDAVIAVARQTNPDDTAELDSLQAGFTAKQQRLAQAQAAEKERKIRSAGVLGNWTGRGQIGVSRSTGNTDNLALSLALDLDRKGIDWQHHNKATADFQRSNGLTTGERYFASYEPRYNLSKRAFVFGIGQFERNPFQGFDGRYAVSGGVGYRLLDGKGLELSIKAGPAWRRTDFVYGGSESSIAALAGFDFDWAITDRLKFTQDTNMVANTGGAATLIVDANNTTLNLVTALEAKVSHRLSARLSYTIDYDSNPPAGATSTDTFSNVTLVYGF